MRYDYDWLVIGSGFGGSVAALRLAEKGHRVGVVECGRRFARRRLRQDRLEPEALLLGPAARAARDLPDDPLPRRLHRLGLGRRGRQPRLREHPLQSAARVLPRPPVGGSGRLGRGAGAPLRHRRVDARRDRVPRRGPRRPAAQGAGRGAGRRRDLQADPRRRLLRRARQGGRRPVLRRRGPAAARAASSAASCMVGCRHNAKNTLVKNYLWFAERLGAEILPEREVTDIEPIGAADGSTATASRPSTRAPGRAGAGAPSPRAASSSPRERSGPTACSRAASSAARCRGSPTASASWCGPTASRSSP